MPLSVQPALPPLLESASHPQFFLSACSASVSSLHLSHFRLSTTLAGPLRPDIPDTKDGAVPCLCFREEKTCQTELGDKAVPCQCHCLHKTVSQGSHRPTPMKRASPEERLPFQLKFLTRKCHSKLCGLRDAIEIHRPKTHVQNKGV